MNFGNLLNNYQEAVAMILFGIGFSNLLLQKNLIKKIIGLNIMDTAMYLFLALKGYIVGRKAPIVVDGVQSVEAYINPIPSGLVLTEKFDNPFVCLGYDFDTEGQRQNDENC